jgi:ubiquinone/menaquinone biosynthesis C-methylase UbiE
MTKDYYSTIAAGYNELHGVEQDEKLEEFLGRIELRNNITLLDVGCGTGRSAEFFDNLHWYGIDPSSGLIAQAPGSVRQRIKEAPAESIPFPDASFDAILSLTALQNFTDAKKGMNEMKRVAKPGAIFLISFLKKSPQAKTLHALMKEEFIVVEAWEQAKDYMYICNAQPI